MLEACKGERFGSAREGEILRVSTDSRFVQAGDLFVAFKGEKYDGHAFVQEAAAKGIAGAVIERSSMPSPLPDCALIVVPNTREGFGRIAARYRQDFTLPVVAVAGSNGKTTTKEIISAVLTQRFNTLTSKASFNNDIGVPTTLLELSAGHAAAVLEFGTNHPGELAPLLKMAKPRYGVLTSIGREHLEFFGDLAGVVREEGSLAEALPSDGKLFMNGDTFGADEIAQRSVAPVVRVGFGAGCEWRAGEVKTDESGTAFEVRSPEPEFSGEYQIPLLGKHQVINALLALAVGAELGLTRREIQGGFRSCVPVKGRLQLLHHNGVRVLNDSYNANADSMRAALETLAALPCAGRRIAVLGDMAELGRHAAEAHAEIGRHVALLGIQKLFVVGEMAQITAESARSAGMNGVEEFTDILETGRAVQGFLKPGDIVLFKASRASALERVIEFVQHQDRTSSGAQQKASNLSE